MAILKEDYMIYVGETNSNNYLLYGSLIKNETYWIQIVSHRDSNIYNIYRKDFNNITDDFPDYIGVNTTNNDVSKDFISIAEWREQQIKTIIDD